MFRTSSSSDSKFKFPIELQLVEALLEFLLLNNYYSYEINCSKNAVPILISAFREFKYSRDLNNDQ